MSSPIPPSSSLRLHLPRLAPSSSSPPSTTCHSLPTPPPTATFPTPSFICTDCDPSANSAAYHRRNLLLEHKALKHIQQFVTCDAEGKPLIINRSPFGGHFHCSLCKEYSSESALVCSLHIQHTCAFALGMGRFVLRAENEVGSPMVWERKIVGVQSKGSGDVFDKSRTTVR
ncbi:hypothetical protein BDY24DRAFT_371101 [Mrakia frigida]|uniref:uncharacterized protein n=1 Tax=Mrakia frigida TaxID=29902 RepID=UPI003FCC13BB